VNVCSACGHANNEAAQFCATCGASLARASEEHRKIVSALFCDVVGSTALGESVDPEALQALLARYFEHMQAIVERHGGVVEKFIGDAVMAVFGLPAVHEDDALRACRAALEMRAAFAELGVRGRIGINTGEVVTGTQERLATGDAVNVAARLQQAAAPDEVLIGEATLALVRDAVDFERLEPLVLKGKAQPVAAFRLLAAHALERRHAAHFVGRDDELALIRAAWARVNSERRCELLTIVGEPGVGKTRLVAEALATIDARVVQGRCLPYGEGITYRPVVEVVKQLGALPSAPAAAAAIRSLLGESDEATSADEIAWAFRKVLEEQASLVVVFDDLQWAEQTFLDLVEGVSLLCSGAPLLLLCLGRAELLDRRPHWPVALRLEPLGGEEADELIGDRVPAPLRERIAHAAGGNPLFLTEMLAMAAERVDVEVPPNLRALLAARLDQLAPPERRVLEHGAVEGELFHRGAVQALTPEETHVTPFLAALTRQELIRPDKAEFPGEDGFRFRHLLIRDAAYDSLPKSTRAELHQRFAAWLEERGVDLVELDEILGYHLEQAYRYRVELGLPADDELAAAARRHLASAGRRALLREDFNAATSLLERAAVLTPPGEVDVRLEMDLTEALFAGPRARDGLQRAGALAERAAAAGDRIGELCLRIKEADLRDWLEPEGGTEQLASVVEQALPVFEAAGDDFALYVAYCALGSAASGRAQMDKSAAAFDRAASYAARAGLADAQLGMRAASRLWGATPVSEVLAWLDDQDGREQRGHEFHLNRVQAMAMLGHIDEARVQLIDLRAEFAERGARLALAASAYTCNRLELLAGDPAAAVAFGEECCSLLDELGQQSFLSTTSGALAEAYYQLGRLEAADTWALRGRELGASDDAMTQMFWRQVRAKVLARRNEYPEAERLAREAVAIGEQTDMLDYQAAAYADLGEVLSLAGRHEEAAEALKQALVRYERKQNLVMTGRVRALLAALREASPV
jgi:class 3 adenylate cyclase/tetratricopeptide (TPR) repeat protein